MHLTLRGRAGVPSFRSPRVFAGIRDGLRAASRAEFRILHFSVQRDHLHLVVEAQDAAALASGARGLSIRVARAINAACGTSGRVWGDRYHTHALKTPREVRNAIVYVLMNFRKHTPGDKRPIDPCSSAAWFEGSDRRCPDHPTRRRRGHHVPGWPRRAGAGEG